MLSPWSTVESFPATDPVSIPTANGSVSHAEFVNSNIAEANAGYWYSNKAYFGSGDVLTALASRNLDKEYPVWYGRRYFRWSDGSQISVDYTVQIGDNAKPSNWDEDVKYVPDPETPRLPNRTRILRPEEVQGLDDPETTRPLLISVHGLTGGSHENYVRAPFCELNQRGVDIETAVITTRGCNRSKITTPILFNAAWTEDLRLFIKHVTTHQPHRPIFLSGYSLGASVLTNYLGQEATHIPHQIKAAVVVGNPWDLMLCHVSLAQSWIGRHVYQPTMTSNLCRLVKNNAKVLETNPLVVKQMAKLRNLKSVNEFDDIMTAPLFGFSSWADYYRSASSVNRLASIHVPTLILAARDDPICGDMGVPYTEAPANPFAHLVTTTHGGHLGWFTQNGERWYSQVLTQYIAAFVSQASLAETVHSTKPARLPRWFREGKFHFETELREIPEQSTAE